MEEDGRNSAVSCGCVVVTKGRENRLNKIYIYVRNLYNKNKFTFLFLRKRERKNERGKQNS